MYTSKNNSASKTNVMPHQVLQSDTFLNVKKMKLYQGFLQYDTYIVFFQQEEINLPVFTAMCYL